MMQPIIPFNKPSIVGNELHYIQQAVHNNWQLSGDGPFSRQVQDLLKAEVGTKSALLTPSCTHALEMTALLLDIQPGDEVIIPAFTFVSTANAFLLYGAKPVFCDVRSDTLNLDETKLEKHITPKTRAIVVVHYAGIACEMDAILEIAQHHQLAVIEDNAHGLFGKYKGKPLGSIGDMATLSFHETKNFQCGEGGALLINNETYIERAEIIRDKGTNRRAFFRGMVDKYTWVDVGSSFLMSDLSAAFLLAQLEKKSYVQATRQRIWNAYMRGFASRSGSYQLQIPTIPLEVDAAYHIFYLILESHTQQLALIDFLKDKGINVVFHYQPLHTSPMGKKLGGNAGDCPVTEDIAVRLVRLPLHISLEPQQVQQIIDTIKAFFE